MSKKSKILMKWVLGIFMGFVCLVYLMPRPVENVTWVSVFSKGAVALLQGKGLQSASDKNAGMENNGSFKQEGEDVLDSANSSDTASTDASMQALSDSTGTGEDQAGREASVGGNINLDEINVEANPSALVQQAALDAAKKAASQKGAKAPAAPVVTANPIPTDEQAMAKVNAQKLKDKTLEEALTSLRKQIEDAHQAVVIAGIDGEDDVLSSSTTTSSSSTKVIVASSVISQQGTTGRRLGIYFGGSSK